MPFDFAPTKTDTRPITRLIEALRGPEPEWWNFIRIQTCACQVARVIGVSVDHLDHIEMGAKIGMPKDAAHTILGAQPTKDWPDMLGADIRPRHVAAALEHYRDTGEALSPFVFVKRDRAIILAGGTP